MSGRRGPKPHRALSGWPAVLVRIRVAGGGVAPAVRPRVASASPLTTSRAAWALAVRMSWLVELTSAVIAPPDAVEMAVASEAGVYVAPGMVSACAVPPMV